ncbi:MAG TPA: hypothetical protein VLH15_07490 [Dehalococcoidales bacterium]|nr:hypothetical protein [Dehalococcoidales bacterium]
MAEGKWAHNIITTHHRMTPPARDGYPNLHHILGLSDKVLTGAFIVNCCWMFAAEDPGYMAAHTHPYDEVIGFVGTNTENVNDLGAEAEMWMDNEKYTVSQSCIMYIPKGLKHCPLTVRNIVRPVFHFDIQLTDEVKFI